MASRTLSLEIMFNTSYGTSSNSVCFFDGSFRNTSLSLSKVVVFTSFVADGLLPVALIGNALVLAAICKNTSLRTTSYIVLSGLALADILGAILSQPSYVSRNIAKRITIFHSLTSHPSKHFCWHFLHLLTLLLLTLVSIERWLHVHRTYFFIG